MSENSRTLTITYGKESELYSFPGGHPMNKSRTRLFGEALSELGQKESGISIQKPVMATEKDLELFHTRDYIEYVKEKSSSTSAAYLDYGDTPSFPGVFEASLYAVGSTLYGMDQILERKVGHAFNPVGGLHHARRDRAGGFCVFNDCAVAISKCVNSLGIQRVAYVDIDAHHGDGVYFGFEDDPRVLIGDIHEDGRFLYPGTGSSEDSGTGDARGTKLNIPLAPGSGDKEFKDALDRILEFVEPQRPEFIFLQCGADSLSGDPITHLKYSAKSHAYAARRLHELSRKVCGGRILAMGGGGYSPNNVRDAWIAVAEELASCSKERK